MQQDSTPLRLLKNAERLMAEKGIAATSVREITEESDANVAAVNYYFGGKTALLLDLLKSRFEHLDAALLERVSSIEAEAKGKTPSVRELAKAYFDVITALGFNSKTGKLDPFILLIQRASAEQEAVLEQAQDYNAPGIAKLVDLMAAEVPADRRACLDVPMLTGMMFTASVAAMPAMSSENRNDVLVAAIKDFLFAGVEAYVSRFAHGI
ncbi:MULTISPECIES: TetR/AcrR family transcriptional regulator [Roseibium]|uniref:TetR/AcrR family transcriptional regulator n=1 Tax=Roseibium TaxID=150830 RepID=UPI003752A756